MPSQEEQEKLKEQEILHEAIVRLYPELPEILGPDSLPFLTGLHIRLAQGSDSQLLEWFHHYPAATQQLLEKKKLAAEELSLERTRSYHLLGDRVSQEPDFSYHCKVGKHLVQLQEVFKRDPLGYPLCPQHQTAMRLKRR
jgi:hypothetical protein